MKKLMLVMLVLSVLPLPPQAQTQTTQEIETVTITEAPQITIPGKLYKMWPEEFYKFKGAYDLANGQVLSLYSFGRRMYAKVIGYDEHEIVATANNAFVALDRQLKVRIDLHDNGDVGGELVMVVPAQKHSSFDASEEKTMQLALH